MSARMGYAVDIRYGGISCGEIPCDTTAEAAALAKEREEKFGRLGFVYRIVERVRERKGRPSRSAMAKEERRAMALDGALRNGGPVVEDREWSGHDCISEMRLAAARPDVLANQLAALGYTEGGDDPADVGAREEGGRR